MKGPELSQFSARYQVKYLRHFKPAESQAFLRDLLSRIAQSCVSRGAAVIGHIKLIATTTEGSYFHGSITSTRTPPTVEAYDIFPHEALTIDLVVLVYGIAKEKIESIVHNIWKELTDEDDEIMVHPKTDPPPPIRKEER